MPLPISYDLRVQSDDDQSRSCPLRVVWDALAAMGIAADGATVRWRDDARGLALDLEASWSGRDGRITVATLGAPPGREAWADVNLIRLSVPIAALGDGPAPYVELALKLATALGWKVWDPQQDRYILLHGRRARETAVPPIASAQGSAIALGAASAPPEPPPLEPVTAQVPRSEPDEPDPQS